ncbi:MAG: hypothetical protein ACK5ME_06215 [Parahaliea sp.]
MSQNLRSRRRFLRTLILGVLCLATLVWAAVDQFDVAPATLLKLAAGTAIGAVGIIFAAGLLVVSLQLLRRLSGQRKEG